ncbi:MAG: hypothetical protein R2748_04415 [Bryobacterales bacterium]
MKKKAGARARRGPRDAIRTVLATFPDIRETPEYFRKENKPYQQMNSNELADCDGLNQAGFETSELIVQWHGNSLTFAFAMALLALPFAMVTGHRGALTPVAFILSSRLAITL